MSSFVDVVFPLPLARAFTYAVPEAWRETVQPGSRVKAVLGTRLVVGFIVRIHDIAPPAEAKPILEVIDPRPLVPADILELAGRLSRRYVSSWGELLRPALFPSVAGKSAVQAALTRAGEAAAVAGLMTAEEAGIAALFDGKSYSLASLKKRSETADSSALIASMVNRGWVETKNAIRKVKAQPAAASSPPAIQLDLDFRVDEAVVKAARAVAGAVDGGSFARFLFWGPADRRAAAYLRAVREVLNRGKRVLFLFPEIGMSRSVAAAFESGLGERIVILHGRLTAGEREDARRRISAADALVVAGPRSTLFTPLSGLGLIIVDEEADESYVQTESPAYDARLGARMRAEISPAVLVLGSEAPTVEAFQSARRDGGIVEVPGVGPPLEAAILDDRREGGLIARALAIRIRAALAAKKTVIVFARRKGYASFLFCPRCGHIPACARCDIALPLSKNRGGRLTCRYCGDSRSAPAVCERCGGRVLEPRGAGVEAVEEEIRRLCPGVRSAVFDSDSIPTRAGRERILDGFAAGEIEVLIGSPLLAHQAGVPPAALVAVLNPEGTLALSDFRAGAKLYGEIRRLMKYADASDPGSATVIQTSLPGHYAVSAAARGDYLSFFEEEIGLRRAMRYPPFSALAEIVLLGKDLRGLSQQARDLRAGLEASGERLEVLGPASAFRPGGRGERSVQVVVKAETSDILDDVLADALKAVRSKRIVVRLD